MYGRRVKVKPPELTEPMTRERMRSLFPQARLVCDCPSRREHCGVGCDRFAGKKVQVAEFFGW